MSVNLVRLRLSTYISLGLALLYLTGLTYLSISMYNFFGHVSLDYVIAFPMILFLAGHTFMVIHIQRKLYPNREITRLVKLLTITFAVLSGIVLLLMLLAVAGLVWALLSDDNARNDWMVIGIELILLLLSIGCFSYQIRGGNRLMTSIQNNYRHELENSIASNP